MFISKNVGLNRHSDLHSMNDNTQNRFRFQSFICYSYIKHLILCFVPFLLLSSCNKPKSINNPKNAVQNSQKPIEESNDLTIGSRDTLPVAKELITRIESQRTNEKYPPLRWDEDKIKRFQDFTQVTDQELSDVLRDSFTPAGMDPNYLDECLLLNEIISNHRWKSFTPAQQVDLAFQWVNRTIFTDHLLLPPVPLRYILQRGSGSEYERAWVFTRLVQQLGFEVFFIGPKEYKNQVPMKIIPIPGGQRKLDFIRFWGVGVLLQGEIRLYDPWSNRAFPGPGNQGIATLHQALANPELVKQWASQKPPFSGCEPNLWTEAELFLVYPLHGMSPRMKYLEEKLKSKQLIAYFDPLAIFAKLTSLSEKNKKSLSVSFWNPKNDRYSPCRVLDTYLPVELGGLDKSGINPVSGLDERVYSTYSKQLYRLDLFPNLPLQETGQAQETLKVLYFRILKNYLEFDDDSVREMAILGLNSQVIPKLTQMREQIETQRELLSKKINDAAIKEWCESADRLIAKLSRARRAKIESEINSLTQQLNELISLKDENIILQYFLFSTASRRINELSYLIAQSLQDQAEDNQARIDYLNMKELQTSTANNWKSAWQWWNRFLTHFPELAKNDSARRAHANDMMQKCQQYIKKNSVNR